MARHDPPLPATGARASSRSESFTEFMARGWSPVAAPPPAVAPPTLTAARRAALRAAFPTTTVVVRSSSAPPRCGDTFYRFRAPSDFLYLAGVALADAVLVCAPDAATLYVRPPSGTDSAEFFTDRDAGALWVGARPSLADLAAATKLTVRPLADLPASFAAPAVELTPSPASPASSAGSQASPGPRAADVAEFLAERRLVKDAFELAELQAAVDATVLGFAELAAELAPGVSERWLEGTFARRARTDGDECGYLPIVAAGEHACVLHWMTNDGTTADGALVLVDAGVERASGYTADVTRTLPVSGTFSPVQRQVVDAVDIARQAAVAAIRPGVTLTEVHDVAMASLATELVAWGVLDASVDEVIATQAYRRFTLHGTSHMLGLDVHDCASASPEVYKGPLAPNMVLTVEPGLYFQPNDTLIAPELRGIGVRLEDDVAVTADGATVLSSALPTRPAAIEQWLRRRQRP